MQKKEIIMKKLVLAALAACLVCGSAVSVSAAQTNSEAVFAKAQGEAGAYAQPEITKIEGESANSSMLHWTKINGVDRYRVYIKNDGGWTRIGETTGNTFIHKNLTPGKTYVYTVRGVDNKGNFVTSYNSAGWSNTFVTSPAAPKLSVTNQGVEVRWSKVQNCDYYRVYRKAAGKSTKTLGDVNGTSFVDRGTAAGVNYSYSVRVVNREGNRWISASSSSSQITRFASPKITKVDNYNSNSSKLYWTKVNGVDRYRVYIKNGGTWTRIGETASDNFIHKNLVNQNTYIYTVRGLNKDGSFATGFDADGFSNTFYTTVPAPKAANVYSGVELKWNRLLNFDYYRVYRRQGSESWKTLGDVKALSYIDSEAKANTEYRYAVRAVNSEGNRWINAMSNTTTHHYYKAPSVNLLENQAQAVKIGWTKTEGAAGYRVFEKVNGSWKRLGDSTKLSYIDSAVSNGKRKTYTIRALDKNGNFISGYNGDGYAHTFNAPVNITRTGFISEYSFYNLAWNAVDGATGYRVYMKTPSAGWKMLGDNHDPIFLHTTNNKDKVVAYCVRALKGDVQITATPKNVTYYYNGKVANGKITVDGVAYFFNNGNFAKGYQKINGKLYYYNSYGQLEKNTIVGSKSEGYYYADENGVCCTSEEMRLAAEFLMNECTGATLKDRAKTGFMVLANKYPYSRSYNNPKKSSDIPAIAIEMFKNKKGNCFRYAASYTCVAKLAGYRTRMCVGATGNGSPHGWCEVLVNGRWLYCDPDANIPGYGNPPYTSYMMSYHYWNVSATFKSEVEIKDGKAIWK